MIYTKKDEEGGKERKGKGNGGLRVHGHEKDFKIKKGSKKKTPTDTDIKQVNREGVM